MWIICVFFINIALDIFLKILEDKGMRQWYLFSQEELNIENVFSLIKSVSLFYNHDS